MVEPPRTQDEKSISIQHLEALCNLHSPLPRSVHLSFVPDEEKIDSLDGKAKFEVSDEFADLNGGFVLDEEQASFSVYELIDVGRRNNLVEILNPLNGYSLAATAVSELSSSGRSVEDDPVVRSALSSMQKKEKQA